ncbi:MAG: hypothetical protein JXR55_08645 [Candidatus Fermentibacteraceae bacterium]|nr:hypothetical protein [Candidatus Fermentibacteraceae bacterium]
MIHAALLFLSIQTVSVYNELNDLYFKSLFQFYYPGENIMMPFCTDSSPELAGRAREYALNWSAFETGLDFSGCQFWTDSITLQKKAGLERGIVSLIPDPDADSLALVFLSDAPCPYEWEGDRYAIETETVHAMSFLRGNPGTPIEPFILLMLMHRLRAQEECMTILDGVSADSVTALYDSLLQEALLYPDPLVNHFARELDSVSRIYLLN